MRNSAIFFYFSYFFFSYQVFFALSFVLAFFFGFFVSTFAFYIVEMWPVKNIFISSMAILGGTIVPLDLLPNVISTWAPYSPFAYFSYMNVKIIQGSIPESLIYIHLINIIFLNIFFFALSYCGFYLGLKKYEGVGC